MFKNWFLLASVSCGVGFGSTFLISRNLQQSTWAGLGTVPAVAASLTILSRQRREEIERQVTQSRLRLDDAQKQEQLFKEEIERQVTQSRLSLNEAQEQEQLAKDSCLKISAHGQKLQTGCTQLRQEVDRLDAKVLDQQNNLQATQAKLAQVQAQGQLASNSVGQSNLQLQSIREAIRQDSATKQQLDAQITALQNRSQSLQTILVDKKVDLRKIEERRNQVSIDIADLDRLLQQKQSVLQGIAPQQQSLQQQISDLLLQKQDQKVLFDNLVVNISTKRNNLVELDNEISERQANLDRITIDLVEIEARKQSAIYSVQISKLALKNIQSEIRQDSAIKEQLNVEITNLQNKKGNFKAEIDSYEVTLTEAQQQISVLEEQQDALELEICNQQQVKEDINSQIAKLEESIFLFSGHSIDEVPNIRISDLHRKWQELSEQISQLEEERNRLSIAVDDLIQSAEGSETPEKWENHLIFKNNPHLRVLKHIDVHETITELEVGTAREQRQFNIRFGEYLEHLPFSISNREGRYLKIAKESIIITDLQNPDDRGQIEQEIDQLNQQKEQLFIAVDELSRSLEDDLQRQAIFRQEIDRLLLQKQELSREITSNRVILDQIRNEREIITIDSNQESNEHQSNACINNYDRRCSCGSTPMPGELFCYGCSC